MSFELSFGSASSPFFSPFSSLVSACSSISTPFCTAYDTLGPSGLTYAINQPAVRAIFANGDLLPMVLKIIDDCPSLQIVIYDGEPSEELLSQLRAKDGVKVLSLKELEALGKSKGEIKVVPPKRSDVCCVMYTSVSLLSFHSPPSSFPRLILVFSSPPGIYWNSQRSHSLPRKPHGLRRCGLNSPPRGPRPHRSLPRLPPYR